MPKNSAAGEPTVDVTILFKNTQMVARSRQNKVLLDPNMLAGIQVRLWVVGSCVLWLRYSRLTCFLAVACTSPLLDPNMLAGIQVCKRSQYGLAWCTIHCEFICSVFICSATRMSMFSKLAPQTHALTRPHPQQRDLASKARLSVRSLRAVPAVGGGAPDTKDPNYGMLDELSAMMAAQAAANASAAAAANATAPAKSGAGRAGGAAAATALLAAALAALL